MFGPPPQSGFLVTPMAPVDPDNPPDVVAYPQDASLHIWDQHRFGVLGLTGAQA